MKSDYRMGGIIASIAAGVLFASTASAHDGGKVNSGYVGDKNHHYLVDSSGNCVRTSSWTKGDMTVDCGAEPVQAAAPPVAPAPPPATPVYEKMTLSGEALFDHDSDNLKETGKASLLQIRDRIQSKGAKVVDIDVVGHTDSTGPEEYNQQLSLRRATAVKDFIVSHDIDPAIIDVSGKGESDPVASNATREGRAQNRRVEVHVGVKAPK